MLVLWDADGNEIRDEYPSNDLHDVLCNPDNAADVDRIVAKLKEISSPDVVALHQLADNHYSVNTVQSLVSLPTIHFPRFSMHPQWTAGIISSESLTELFRLIRGSCETNFGASASSCDGSLLQQTSRCQWFITMMCISAHLIWSRTSARGISWSKLLASFLSRQR